MGGICVIVGFMFGTLSYIAISTYFIFVETNLILVLGILCTLLITTIIGTMPSTRAASFQGDHHGDPGTWKGPFYFADGGQAKKGVAQFS